MSFLGGGVVFKNNDATEASRNISVAYGIGSFKVPKMVLKL